MTLTFDLFVSNCAYKLWIWWKCREAVWTMGRSQTSSKRSVSKTILCKLYTYLDDQLRWAICFSGSPSLCFTLFCWYSFFLLLHSWLNKLIDWLIDWSAAKGRTHREQEPCWDGRLRQFGAVAVVVIGSRRWCSAFACVHCCWRSHVAPCARGPPASSSAGPRLQCQHRRPCTKHNIAQYITTPPVDVLKRGGI